ncbi:MAG: translocation/assembly module TamB domain-containing protein [Rikenellaceae bacterium]
MIISTAILLLVLSPIFASLLLSLPIVQNGLVGYASRKASAYLDTEVSLKHIDITTTGSLQIKDLLIRDLQGDTLIFASQLNSRFLGYSPFERRLRLGRTTLQSGMLNLQQRDNGEMNIKQITRLLASENPKGGILIDINQVELKQSRLVIEQLRHRNPKYGVDYGKMLINELDARVDRLVINGNDVTGEIKHFTGVEQSGFVVSNLSGAVAVSMGGVEFLDMTLSSRWSDLKISRLTLSDSNWERYRNFNTSTSIYVDIEDGYLSSDDVAYFAPELRRWGMQLNKINLTAQGKVDDLSINIDNISYGDSTQIAAVMSLKGLPQIKTTKLDLTIDEMVSSASDVEAIKQMLSGKGFEPEIYRTIAKAGRITLQGELHGVLGDMTTTLKSNSQLGDISTSMAVVWSSGNTPSAVSIKGDVALNNLPLNRLTTPRQRLGAATLRANVVGQIDPTEGISANIMAAIQSVAWRGYNYRNLDVAGRLNAKDLRATISCNDPNLIFGLTAMFDNVDMMGDDNETVLSRDSRSTISLNLMHANLKELGWSGGVESTLAADVSLFAQGDNVERATGGAVVRQLKYTFDGEVIESDSAALHFESSTGYHMVNLESDFATATFESSDSVSHISQYLSSALQEYLPALYRERVEMRGSPQFSSAIEMASGTTSKESDSRAENLVEIAESKKETKKSRKSRSANAPQRGNISTLQVKVVDMTPILAIVDESMTIDKESVLDLEFDVSSGRFKGGVKSNYIERKSMLAAGIDINFHNTADSILLVGSVDELYLGTIGMSNARLDASAHDNKVEIEGGYNTSEDESYAQISAEIGLSRHTQGRASSVELDVVLHPSVINNQGQVWDLSAETIGIRHAGVEINRFEVSSDNQHMLLDGRASTSVNDTINMVMQNFDLSVITTFISRLGYQLEGKTNGHIGVASALNDARIEANIRLDSVSVNTIPAPAMNLDAMWDSKLNRARLTLSNRNNGDMILRGYYIPSQVSYYADLQANGIDMGLLDPPLNGVITNTTGSANMTLTLQGERRNASIEGRIDLTNGATTVDFTQVRYTLPKASFTVKDNIISARNITIKDEEGGSGKMSISVDIKQLTNIEYNLTVSPNKMLVLNTTERDNDVFYGNLYASGMASIRGDRSGSRMDIAAVSENNSHFFMQLLSKSTISSADFITFVEARRESKEETSLRQMINERNQRAQNTTASLEVNLSLDVRPNTEVQLVIDPTVGDIIKSRGEGRFNLSINPKENLMEMYGDYTISEGSYLFTLSNIINKRFVINPNSTIQWNGSPTDPTLNIDAIYQLKTSLQPLMSTESTRAVPVECVIKLSDRLTSPEVSFAIDFPSLDSEQQAVVSSMFNDQEVISRQFFYLMLANSFIPESSGIDSEFGVSTTAATGFELLTNQLSNWLSTSNYNIIIRYRPESELTGDEVDIGFSRGLINNRLLLEVEGNYVANGTEALSQSGSNLVGEAYLTWLIDQAGALQLRGFTQTIDRFDETQGLQETGVGVTYREDFEDFADLRAKVKARFAASPERLARREERKRAKEREIEQNN